MGKTGCCCCNSNCTGPATLEEMSFSVGGLHPFSKVMNLRVCDTYTPQCSSDTVLDTCPERTISLPGDLKVPECCVTVYAQVPEGEGCSTGGRLDRLNTQRNDWDVSVSSSQPCVPVVGAPPTGTFPWTFYYKGYLESQLFRSIAAMRCFDGFKLVICPVAIGEDAKWKLTLTAYFRVLANSVTRGACSGRSQTNRLVGGPLCSGLSVEHKCCIPIVDAFQNCTGAFNGTWSTSPVCSDTVDDVDYTSAADPVAACSSYKTQTREILIPRSSCDISGSLSFPSSAIVGGVGDVSLGLNVLSKIMSNCPTPVQVCRNETTQSLACGSITGDNTVGYAYEALTENWSVMLG